ncbi:MAG: VPLPA-CTERM sorting domain-containing protein [Thiogranum sp.]
MKKKNSLVALLTTSVSLVAISAQAAQVSIPVTNPGAETGNMTGWTTTVTNWPDNDYSAVNNPVESQSGAYYFGLDTAVMPANPTDLVTGSYPPESTMTSTSLDLSAYNGSMSELSLYAWGRTGDLTLVLEDYDIGGFYEYSFKQTVGVWLKDINGDTFYGLGFGTNGGNAWNEEGGGFSWWSQWDTEKDNIYGVSIYLDSGFSNWGNAWDTPDLDTIDPLTIDAAYYTWTGGDGLYYEDSDLSAYSGAQLPVIGFDDIRLEVTTVPVPAAIWLFGSGLIGLMGIARRRKA